MEGKMRCDEKEKDKDEDNDKDMDRENKSRIGYNMLIKFFRLKLFPSLSYFYVYS